MYGTASSKLDERVNTTSTAYLITGLEEFTGYFVQVHAETSVSGAPSVIEQAKTLEDGKLFALEGYSRIERTAVPIGNLKKKTLEVPRSWSVGVSWNSFFFSKASGLDLLRWNILKGTEAAILTTKRYHEHLCHFYLGDPPCP